MSGSPSNVGEPAHGQQPAEVVLRHIRKMATGPNTYNLSDCQLLERFRGLPEEAASRPW